MKISKTYHIRKKGSGAGKIRKNPAYCQKHKILKRNFWSQQKGGVTWGCPKCEQPQEPYTGPRRNDNPGPLSRIEELKKLKKAELSESESKQPDKKKILFFEIGPACRICGYPTGEDWTITDQIIICHNPKCKHIYERTKWSGGQ